MVAIMTVDELKGEWSMDEWIDLLTHEGTCMCTCIYT